MTGLGDVQSFPVIAGFVKTDKDLSPLPNPTTPSSPRSSYEPTPQQNQSTLSLHFSLSLLPILISHQFLTSV